MGISVREINSDNFGHCVEIVNDDTELIVTIDYGPRIVSVKTAECRSLIYCGLDELLDRFHGHKMRITLEKSTNAVYCDDRAVVYSVSEEGVRFVQTLTEPVPLELAMTVFFGTEDESKDINILHTVTNKSKENVKLSIYTETPFLHEGFVFVPQSTAEEKEKPSRILTLWNGVDWTDDRLYIGRKYITAAAGDNPVRLKIGSNNTEGKCGYISGNGSFIKHYVHNIGALYPFCSCSTFATSGAEYLSIQTSSPFYRLISGESANHTEIWKLSPAVNNCYANDECSIDKITG